MAYNLRFTSKLKPMRNGDIQVTTVGSSALSAMVGNTTPAFTASIAFLQVLDTLTGNFWQFAIGTELYCCFAGTTVGGAAICSYTISGAGISITFLQSDIDAALGFNAGAQTVTGNPALDVVTLAAMLPS